MIENSYLIIFFIYILYFRKCIGINVHVCLSLLLLERFNKLKKNLKETKYRDKKSA